MADKDLETPDSSDQIYTARGGDVDRFRPIFTGDVFRLEDDNVVIVLQHPCALREGVHLLSRILVAPVSPGSIRSKWANCSYKIMPLPELFQDGSKQVVDFSKLDILESACLKIDDRVASLSLYGVNLLLQRWVHHNSRVVIPTPTYSGETVGPFEEADLAAEWCYQRNGKVDEPIVEFDSWLREDVGTPNRQSMLNDAQRRSSVRRDMNFKLRKL